MEKNTNDAYFAVYLPLLREGIAPPLPVVGGSMGPYLASERDAVVLAPMEGIHPRVGDICLYRRDNGAYILHRIVGRRGDTYTFAGDAQTEREYGIRCDQLLGCVTAVVRKGKKRTGGFWWHFFRTVWIALLPWRRELVAVYGKCARSRCAAPPDTTHEMDR